MLVAAVAMLVCLAVQAVPSTSAGYLAKVSNTNVTAATAANFTCVGALAVDKSAALFEYAFGESSGATTAADTGALGTRTGTYVGTMTSSAVTPIACPRDPGTAYLLNGTTSYANYNQLQANPTTFSLEVWFKTTVASGKLMGFGNVATGASSNYDRHLYLTTAGAIAFGTRNGVTQVVTSPLSYNDGSWHQAVATFSAGTGMILYLDGANVAFNTLFIQAQNYSGYWRIGYDNLNGWPSIGANRFFAGSLRFAAVYTTVLTQAQVTNHYVTGR